MPCGCILAILGCPRLAILVTWMTGWFGPQFETSIWPFLGFVFMPWTALAFVACNQWVGPYSQNGVEYIIIMAIAIFTDLSSWRVTKKQGKEPRR
jgi:hypothetical protein